MSGQLKEVRERIKSVKSTQQITKAMKMVSAAKLRRAQQAIVQLRPYSNRLNKMLVNILSNLEDGANTAFNQERSVTHPLIVVVTSDRGLCGAFNSNVIKEAVKVIKNDYADAAKNGNLHLLFIGKKGFDYFKKRYSNCHLIDDHVNAFADLNFNASSVIAQFIMDGFENYEFDAVHIAYGRFRNAAVQIPECEKFLPVPKQPKAVAKVKAYKADYLFEPDKESLLKELIPSILRTKFHRYLLDVNASQLAARMTAMASATDNAEELLKELRINYNKARQAAITKELSEIVGGAAALGG